ncbi:DUF3052 family protein [Roseovarius aestuarii]|uniref:DUF3052 domain-containing protein n=1 Tax=Roseovarius aestuarii TaxID=475083 RepID=A0A1X7BXM2_9RHOB|nr:DUF3052 family protein [Roseovarius aestuarii]SMC14363.1 hypothetical protein ROA7745_04230 [Roseovarius aestuarii]
MVGYSGRPLHAKLGLKPGIKAVLLDEPDNYAELLGPNVPDVVFQRKLTSGAAFTHLFTTRRAELEKSLRIALPVMARDGMIWVSWPKKASKRPTDVTEDVIREIALPMGLLDVKVCAVDAVWSGLKLMIRKELR